jgi:glycosyltransferase involved in cell wall biosynthesis
MHILVFNQHHHNPDCPATCRHYTFLQELAKKHRVTLISSDGWRKTRITNVYNWAPEKVRIYECKSPYENAMGVFQRFRSFSKYSIYALFKGLTIPKPDVIWAVSTPLSTPWVASKVARLRNIPWVFEVQDLWPQFPIEMGAVKNSQLQRLLFNLEANLCESAAHIITLSPDMTAYMCSLDVAKNKVSTVLNGTDFELIDAISAAGLENIKAAYGLLGKKIILYAGTYGRANAIPSLMQTIRYMASDPNIVFILAGNGYYEPQLQHLALEVPNLKLLPAQPRFKIFELFKLADLSLVTFNNLPVLSSNSPSKLYDSLACGTPVIVTNPGWTKSFIEKHQAGWYSPAEQPLKLANTIKQALKNPKELKSFGKNGAAVARTQFDRQLMINKLEDIFQNAVN